MATVKASEMRAQTSDELKTKLVSLKKEQFNLRFKVASGENENSSRIRIIRREIARLKTVLSEKIVTTIKETGK
jgi:large subunit ribosomal protein L29